MDAALIGRLERHLDKVEIEEALYRYCRAMDRGDTEMLKTVFHDDATVNYGVFRGRASETLFASSEDSPWQSMQHTVATALIEIDDDHALSEAHFIAYIFRKGDNGPVDCWSSGRYIDRFERRSGHWAIAHRDVVHTWSRIEPAGARMWEHGPLKGAVTLARRDREDPIYAALGRFRGGRD